MSPSTRLQPDIYIFDLDGVVYLGDQPIPHAADAINRLVKADKGIYFLTNNSSQTRAAYKTKLAKMGIDIEPSHIYTSAYATALYLKDQGAEGKTAFVIGEQGVAAELAAAGVVPITEPDAVPFESVDYVVVGIDRAFTYQKLRFAHACIARGRAEFIATNRDATYPSESGETPGAGSIVASVVTATGCEPLTIGKPEPPALLEILRAAQTDPSRALMVGDRLDTDIAIGKRCGVPTALVLTGVTSRSFAETASLDLRPDRIIGSLLELLEQV